MLVGAPPQEAGGDERLETVGATRADGAEHGVLVHVEVAAAQRREPLERVDHVARTAVPRPHELVAPVVGGHDAHVVRRQLQEAHDAAAAQVLEVAVDGGAVVEEAVEVVSQRDLWSARRSRRQDRRLRVGERPEAACADHGLSCPDTGLLLLTFVVVRVVGGAGRRVRSGTVDADDAREAVRVRRRRRHGGLRGGGERRALGR
mmetsp:Transcript_8876/g.36666  ORF Transcript_8876/g.36666 Transcript_8876/m.36666 type:complete len:204 (-) Transcript_8876:299-910(-)